MPTARRGWKLLRRAGAIFFSIDGTQWAGALAYSAFASLFPMILLGITAASFLGDRERAVHAVIGFLGNELPMSTDMQRLVASVISSMADPRGRAGAAALLILVWTASQCLSTFIYATNRAWSTPATNWWRLPLKSLLLLALMAGAAPVGMLASVLTRSAARRLPGGDAYMFSGAAHLLLPMSMEFCGLSLFYRFAPCRPTRFAEVRAAALIATLLLRAAETMFVIYLEYFAASNAVYGVFGGIMALLLWIYLSGCVFIYGACLCSARAEVSAARRPFVAPP